MQVGTLSRSFILQSIRILKSPFSADCRGSGGLIHQTATLESLPRWCALGMTASDVAAFAVHRVPSNTVYRKLIDSGAALSTSFWHSLFSRQSGPIFGSEVLKWHLPTGRRAWRGPGIKAYVREYLLNRRSFENRRNHLQLTAAVRAMFQIEVKHPLQ
jgi:hypothetical protein